MSSYPPPPDAPDVLPGEDGGDYAGRKAEAAAIADATRLPEWVLLAEIARRQRHGRAAPDDAALAERLRRAYHAPSALVDSFPGTADRWLRVAAEARNIAIAAIVGEIDPGARLAAAAPDAFRGTMIITERDMPARCRVGVHSGPSSDLRVLTCALSPGHPAGVRVGVIEHRTLSGEDFYTPEEVPR